MKTGRRSFLKGVSGATAAALALTGERGESAALPPGPRPFGPSRSLLELEGQIVGAPHSAEGGGASAVVSGFLDSDFVLRKDVVGIEYQALALEVGPSMSSTFYDWVRAFFERNFQRKNGAVIAADYNYREQSIREFRDALITEVSFPALDAASKDPAFLGVEIQPEFAQFALGQGEKIPPPPASKTKNWLRSRFLVELGGLEEACKRVSKVDAFTVKMKAQDSTDVPRIVAPDAYLEVGNVVLTLPLADVQPFLDWFEELVIRGNPEKEKSGALIYLSPNGKDELLRVDLSQVGIVSVGESKADSGADSLKHFRVELYVEEMKLQIAGGPQ
jgi:hypothetical protein